MTNEDEFEGKTVEQLRELANERGTELHGASRRADVIARLQGREPDSDVGDMGAGQVQATIDREEDRGYRGEVPDPTPNFNYSVAGNDAPTPETDPDLAAEARRNARQR